MPLVSDAFPHNYATPYPYFKTLKELDKWADEVGSAKKLKGVLPYIPRPRRRHDDHGGGGKMLVCHDYKGGYTERFDSVSYTFNFWSNCDTFVYFSHHRVTVPPPGWINAAHRQGVKILGVLIFEPGADEDCLRLILGNVPQIPTGPAKPPASSSSTSTSPRLSLSPHYARLLAELAYHRGFDGYLLNFECPLQGKMEQAQTVAAWVSVLEAELKDRVGKYAEAIWYDSVIFSGDLRWQDRLNSLNLPFFLSSSGIFTNYTWSSKTYPELSKQYFLSLPTTLTSAQQQKNKKSLTLSDIYIGIDTWGRGSHGGGQFGCYRALNHIYRTSPDLSVALFAPAWTWESIQDKQGFSWGMWWADERKLWVGPEGGEGTWKEVVVPPAPAPRKESTVPCECDAEPFRPVSACFGKGKERGRGKTPPDIVELPVHMTFCPGVGWAWWVDGVCVFRGGNENEKEEEGGGWTDVDKQTSLGDLVWPRPKVEWEDGNGNGGKGLKLPEVVPEIWFKEAWNGGSSLRFLVIVDDDDDVDEKNQREERREEREEDWGMFRNIWVPVQSVSVSSMRVYEVSLVCKVEVVDVDADVDVDVGVSVRSLGYANANGEDDDDGRVLVTIVDASREDDLKGRGWSRVTIQFVVDAHRDSRSGYDDQDDDHVEVAVGLVVAIVSEKALLKPLSVPVLLGQLNVYPRAARPLDGSSSSSAAFKSRVLWVDFTPALPLNDPRFSGGAAGLLRWEIAATLPSPNPSLVYHQITSPETPISALSIYHPEFFPRFLYFNIYLLSHHYHRHRTVGDDGRGRERVLNPEEAMWIGTSGGGLEENAFVVPKLEGILLKKMKKLLVNDESEGGKVRIYVQGVDVNGRVMEWEDCAYVDCEL